MASTNQVNQKRADAERLTDIFTAMQRSFVLNLSKELSKESVSFPQYFLLCFLLDEAEPLSMTAVAERMRHTTAAATGIVDRLEKLGYAKRGNAPKDRRKILVHITEKGKALVHQVREGLVGNILGLMEHLDPEEQKSWLIINEKVFPHCPK